MDTLTPWANKSFVLEMTDEANRRYFSDCSGLGWRFCVASAALSITGAGATFPYPMYSKWFDEYHKKDANIEINYQSIGSGGGIRQVTEGTVDFGASDGPMNDEQLKAYPGQARFCGPALPDRARSGRPHVQHSRRHRGVEFYAGSARGNFSRQNHQME